VFAVKPGQMVEEIDLQVPLTKSFLTGQRKLNQARRKTNRVLTSKYSIYSFIPVAGGYQFRRFTNMFFLVISILAMVGWYGDNIFNAPFAPGATISVLVIVIGAALIFEGFDDFYRHKEDSLQNNTAISRVRNGALEKTTWGDLLPGDLVVVQDRGQIPADILLVYSSGADKKGSICYVEASGIDGETNLKIKEVVPYIRKQINSENVFDIKEHLPSESRTSGFTKKPSILRSPSVMRLNQEKDMVSSSLELYTSGVYTYEQPNSFLQFNGKFSPDMNLSDDANHHPLGFANMLLRGSTLRNTKWIVGVVVYAGAETKLQLSKKKTPAKFGRIDIFVNRSLTMVLGLYVFLVVVFVILLYTVAFDTANWWYFNFTSSTSGFSIPGPVAYLFTFACLFANIIPIPILFAIEVSNFYQRYVMENDLEMYHSKTDTPARCKTSNLICEVGQITHIFSDKTGTLTRNEMKLIGVYIGGKMYGFIPPELTAEQITSGTPLEAIPEEDAKLSIGPVIEIEDESPEEDDCSLRSIQVDEVFQEVRELLEDVDNLSETRRSVMDFFVFLAVCHTVVVEYDDDTGKVSFNAESPDEEAFVSAASQLGIVLQETSDGVIRIATPEGEFAYQVLAINAFNSTRKRMSILLRRLWDETTVLMMKGADNVMFERLAPGQNVLKDRMSVSLLRYSWAGLRTLVMGSREIPQEEYTTWEKLHKVAMLSPGTERAKALADAAQVIERDMELVGASAIEDQLQLGVPEAIQTLRDAGVQVWVLTGDKIETAINIGLSSNLIDAKLLQLQLVDNDVEALVIRMEQTLLLAEDLLSKQAMTVSSALGFRMDVAMIISGESLELLLAAQKGTPELEYLLLKVARICKVVLACRVSPAQKSLIVEMVRYAKDIGLGQRAPVTLAIGDGANDVPMIQSAHVGVGISGHEGMQAVNNADFSIAQFRFLVRMMLVHGRWNYRRQANMIVYIIYSWLLYIWVMASFLPLSLYSGQQVYYFTSFTAVFAYWANVGICTFAWFDKDISDPCILANPWTYLRGIESKDLNVWKTFTLISRSFLHMLIFGACIFGVFSSTVSLETLGAGLYVALCLFLLVRQFTMGTTFTAVTFVVFLLMLTLFFVFVYSVTPWIFTNNGFIWAGIIVSIAAALAFEMSLKFIRYEWFPTHLQILIEQDRGFFHGEKLAPGAHRDAFRVLGETAKLSVLPIVLGFDSIKNSLHGPQGQPTLKSNLTLMSARGNFDYDYTNEDGDEAEEMKLTVVQSRFQMIRPATTAFNLVKSTVLKLRAASGDARRNSAESYDSGEAEHVNEGVNPKDDKFDQEKEDMQTI